MTRAPLESGERDLSDLDPAEEVGGPEEDGHGGDTGPDHRLVGQVHAVQVRAQDLNLEISVGDQDPHVFGPPGSGSGSFPFLIKSGLK